MQLSFTRRLGQEIRFFAAKLLGWERVPSQAMATTTDVFVAAMFFHSIVVDSRSGLEWAFIESGMGWDGWVGGVAAGKEKKSSAWERNEQIEQMQPKKVGRERD